METATLDDLMALNEQLTALAEAGVPLVVSGEERDLARTLEGVNAVVARRVSRGADLEEALESDPAIPGWYRCLVLLGLQSRNMEVALESSNRLATSVEDTRRTAAAAYFYPLVVCGLAYLGMIGFSLFFVPTLEQTYDNLEIEPGPGLKVLLAVRDALPFWVAVPPILLLLWIVWRTTRRSRVARAIVRPGKGLLWLPGISRSATEARWAGFAESLALLERRGVPLKESLPLAACASGDAHLADAARALAADFEYDPSPRKDSPAAKRFPPFLRWAILRSESTVGRVRALEMASRVYGQASRRSAERSRVVAPMVVCVILGGGVTLLYALAVFLPVVELLRTLSS